MGRIAWVMGVIFLPASGALMYQSLVSSDLSVRLLALALGLLCIDQARMATVDLQQVRQLQASLSDPRLDRFRRVTLVTIGVELLGFYGALGQLGLGGLLVMLSQIGFHGNAGILLHPKTNHIQDWGMGDRIPVIVADAVGAALLGLWWLGVFPVVTAGIMLGMLLVYGLIKYVMPKKSPSYQAEADR